MERTGEVIESKNGEIVVMFCRPTDCENCGACMGGQKNTQVKFKGQADVGDQVVVQMPSSQVMKAAALAYVIPLIGLVVGLIIGNSLGFGDQANVTALIGGVIGLALSLGVVKLADLTIKGKSDWTPHIVKILSKARTQGLRGEGSFNE